MDIKKLKLKKVKVMELSNNAETLPLDQTAKIAGGGPSGLLWCETNYADCTSYSVYPCNQES